MKQREEEEGSERVRLLRNLLTRLREKESARLRNFRRDEAQDAITEPSDDLEIARSDEELELHASLVARSEDRLNEIQAAFERLDEGHYGICKRCKHEIPIERLMALPFAVNCAECESKRQAGRDVGTIDEQSLHRWDVPEGMVESLGKEDVLEAPEEEARTSEGQAPFAPAISVPKSEPLPQKKTKRPRR